MTPFAQSQVQSARTFALIGFIFFAVMAAIWGLVMTSVGVSLLVSGGTPTFYGVFPLVFPFGTFLALSIAFAAWSWSVLKSIESGTVATAQTPSLIIGIFGLFPPIGAIIGGVFFLLVYSKLSSAQIYAKAPPPSYGPPQPTARVCINCGRPVAMDGKFCQHCGHELPE